MEWDAFRAAAAELAALGEEQFKKTSLCILGTIRKDGSARVSPCEIYIVDGELLLGMMWQSRKALDLIRDPRIAVHTAQCDRNGTEGDVKLYGKVRDVTDPGLRERYGDTLQAAIDWRPEEPYHLFALDIERAAFIRFGEGRKALRWDAERGLERIRHPDDKEEPPG